MKTYRTHEAQSYFENERSAFRALRSGGLPPENIISYHGCFRRGGTYNIILEYADKGTLEEYMSTLHPPTNVRDILTFWERCLALLNGLVQIHGTPKPNPYEPSTLLGYVISYIKPGSVD